MSGLSISTKQRAASEPNAILRGPLLPIVIAALSACRPIKSNKIDSKISKHIK